MVIETVRKDANSCNRHIFTKINANNFIIAYFDCETILFLPGALLEVFVINKLLAINFY